MISTVERRASRKPALSEAEGSCLPGGDTRLSTVWTESVYTPQR
jgi:hypothetical protein